MGSDDVEAINAVAGELWNSHPNKFADRIIRPFFFQAEDGIRDADVTGVQTCALPILQQVLICPVTDSDTGSLSYTDPANQLLLDRDEMIWFWDQYVPDPAARRHPDASPLQAMFLTGVPPAVILTAEHDVLRDEGELYAMRLAQAGVPVEHRRFAGQIHGFLGRIGVLPGSADGLRYIAGQVGNALSGPAG